MSTTLRVQPRRSTIFMALVLVLSVVPKQGMVTHMIPRRSRPSMSNVRAVTSSASVESSPPEIPITAVLHPMWRSLCLSPRHWRLIISSALALMDALSSGMNGLPETFLVREVSPTSMSNPM